jgi:hypothetical protein
MTLQNGSVHDRALPFSGISIESPSAMVRDTSPLFPDASNARKDVLPIRYSQQRTDGLLPTCALIALQNAAT